MAMPAGKRFENGYATISGVPNAKNYRQISSACKSAGIKIGQSSARGIFLSAMKKIAKPLCESNGMESQEDLLWEIANNPNFQIIIAELLKEMD